MLMLLPGLICDASIYAPQSAAFRDSRVVDGYGLRDSLEDMAQHVLDTAPESFDLLGHSMGARVALEIVRAAPTRVRRLALVSTGTNALQPGEVRKRFDLRRIGREQGMEALVDAWLPPMVAPANRANPDIMDPLRAMCLRAGLKTFEAQIDALLARNEAESLLPTIACPTLVMTGSEDSWSPPAQHEAMAAALPNSELVIVEGAGHMIQLEAPDAVNDAIASWLARPANV